MAGRLEGIGGAAASAQDHGGLLDNHALYNIAFGLFEFGSAESSKRCVRAAPSLEWDGVDLIAPGLGEH